MASCVEFVFDTFTPARIKALAFRTPTRRSAIGMGVLLAFVCGSPLPYPAKRPVIVFEAIDRPSRRRTANHPPTCSGPAVPRRRPSPSKGDRGGYGVEAGKKLKALCASPDTLQRA